MSYDQTEDRMLRYKGYDSRSPKMELLLPNRRYCRIMFIHTRQTRH
jgi:hypothetical protein